MNDVVYWITRIALVAGWLLVATRVWRREPAHGWRTVAVAAILFASMRALRWNYGLLEGGRALLRSTGTYDDRIVAKIVLGGLLAAATAAAVFLLRRIGDRALRTALLGTLLQVALVLVETCSLDDAMPRWLVTQPGRYLAEGAFLALALAGALQRAGATPRGGSA